MSHDIATLNTRNSTHLRKIIAQAARAKLGAPMRRTRRHYDWAALDAVSAAAHEVVPGTPLFAWIDLQPSQITSLTVAAEMWIRRYCQAYGPLDGRIDVGAHLGIPGRAVLMS